MDPAENLGHRYGASFTGLDDLAGGLEAVECEDDVVDAGGDLHAGRSVLPSVATIEPDFRALRKRTDLGPRDVAVFRMELGVDLRLAVGANIDLADVGVVAGNAQDEIVFARRQRHGERCLAGLFVAVDKYVGSGRL